LPGKQNKKNHTAKRILLKRNTLDKEAEKHTRRGGGGGGGLEEKGSRGKRVARDTESKST